MFKRKKQSTVEAQIAEASQLAGGAIAFVEAMASSLETAADLHHEAAQRASDEADAAYAEYLRLDSLAGYADQQGFDTTALAGKFRNLVTA